MKIKVHLEDGILELISENYSPINGEWVIFGPKFSVRAVNIGITTVYVSLCCQDLFLHYQLNHIR